MDSGYAQTSQVPFKPYTTPAPYPYGTPPSTYPSPYVTPLRQDTVVVEELLKLVQAQADIIRALTAQVGRLAAPDRHPVA